MTETGTVAAMNPPDDRRPGTFGLPLEHTELRVVNDHGIDLGDNQAGELWARSAIDNAFMSGYFREDDKTRETIRDGWIRTGDICLRRDDGYYVFVDRLKDTIRRRGENLSSYLVEKAILDHPDVLEVAAIGVPSALTEEDVLVVVVPRPGSQITPEAVHEWSRSRLGDFMRPRYVEFRKALPRTETGRVHKFTLRKESHAAAWDAERSDSVG